MDPKTDHDAFSTAFDALQEGAPAAGSGVAAPATPPAGDMAAGVAAGSGEGSAASGSDADDGVADGGGAAPGAPAGDAAAGDAGAGAPASGVPADEGTAPAGGAATTPDLAAELAALQAKFDTLTAQREAPAAVTPPAAEPAQAAPAPIYSADEQATLDKYKTDWPDIHMGEALQRRAEYRALTGYIFEQLSAQIAPLMEFAQRQQARTQYGDIVEKVPDYDDVRDKAIAWTQTQPKFLRDAYQRVIEAGDPEDVADLIARYKSETGAAATPIAAPAAAPAAPAAPISPAATAAAAKLRVVQSARTEPTPPADSGDFDGTFEKLTQAPTR